ncbi:MAG: molybdate ABC transporter substrate-binding protein [Vicinamibacterales bacterium]
MGNGETSGRDRAPHPRLRILVALAAVLLGAQSAAGASASASVRVRVAAAADLKFALDAVLVAFAEDVGRAAAIDVDVVYGSSGMLATQIRDGAPFDIFLSADEAYVDPLVSANLTRGPGSLYAIGRLVLFSPRGSALTATSWPGSIVALLESGTVPRLAIANPAHAPYGRAAESALRARGLWERLQPRLVLGENVAQAAQFATSGNAAAGLIALALAMSPPLADAGNYVLVPESDHTPLKQRMVLLARAPAQAAELFAYLQQPRARSILARFGFSTPSA